MIGIGEIHYSTTPYYNVQTHTNDFKKRPVLIIGKADSGDYTVLPLSRVTNRSKVDPNYDILIIPQNYPKLNLSAESYVRTHKQTVVNNASIIGRIIGDVKKDYPTLFREIMDKLQEFNEQIRDNAI